MTDNSALETELARLQAEGIAVLREGRPRVPPLQFLLFHLAEWIDQRHIAAIQKTFPDGRRTFNPVFIHLPADGCRLTDLARMANMSKQAMAEIVEEMIALGYLARFPDPSDRRAKIIVRAPKGLEAHMAAMEAFAEVDDTLAGYLGKERLIQLRQELGNALAAIGAEDGETHNS
ncbi:MAG: MarR family winged helix-turn-helix transcriptional regulator [Pseudomonadota bacterium]